MKKDTVYFTLCSNNYLPFALSLGQSLRTFHTDLKFVIGLVDHLDPKINYSDWKDFEFLPCFDLGYSEFEDMLSRYNIIEFNTAVKPFYFEYLFTKYPDVDRIFYLDPDLFFYQSPKILKDTFGEAEILLTPNLIETTNQVSTGELASLRHGMFNLGFIGLKRGDESFRLIHWWKERLRFHCRIDKCRGIFVDQKWIDLAPMFFEKIYSVKHPGWNMAWWNLSERSLLKTKLGYSVNQPDIPLIFYHFSGYKPNKTQLTERQLTEEFQSTSSEALAGLYAEYKSHLLTNDYEFLSQLKPRLTFKQVTNSVWNRMGRKIKSKMINAIFRIFGV